MMQRMAHRVLKKYGNRRLYDTTDSRYVTLAEVEALIQAGEDVEVVDAKTGEDLTRSVLAQIISERPQSRAVLPVDFLKEVIRTGASPEARERLGQQLMGFLRGMADVQRTFLQQMQQAAVDSLRLNPFYAPFGFPPPQRPQDAPAPPPETVGRDDPKTQEEIAQLRAELRATQRILEALVRGGGVGPAGQEPGDSGG